MDRLVNAVRTSYRGVVRSLEDAFTAFAKLDAQGRDWFEGNRRDHTLLAAFEVLHGEGYHFVDRQDQAEFEALVGLLKQCEEEVPHDRMGRRGKEGRGQRIRVRDREGRPLPAETQ